MNKIIIASLVIFIFSGCSSSKDRRLENYKTQARGNQMRCEADGLERGTDEYHNCMMGMMKNDLHNRQQALKDMRERARNAPIRRTIHCTSKRGVGYGTQATIETECR